MIHNFLFLFSILFYSSCKSGKKESPLFQSITDSGIEFVNNVEDGKIENSFLFRNFYNGGGVAIGDINNDGLCDVLLTSNMGDNKLYLNKGNWKFEDISRKAGLRQDSLWSTGVTMADINGDGWLDIYECNSGHMHNGHRRNKLYINNHDLTFTESSKQYGLDIAAYTTQVSFFDYDLDGDLDCFMINNSPIPVNQLNYSNRRDLPEQEWTVGSFLKGGGDHFFRNDDGNFNEITKQAGLHGSLIRFGLGVSVGDMNGDNYPDVYVSNDSYERDYLYINQKNGTFKDEFEQWFEHTSMSSMGTDLVDINNDGYPEVFSTDMLPDDEFRLKTTGAFDNIDLYRSKLQAGFYHQFVQNCLQLNNKNGTFSEIAFFSGVHASDWSWGALMFDADNDGLNDIYVCNGVNRDVIDLDFIDFFANDVLQKMVLTGKKENIDEILKNIPRNPLPNKAYRNKGNLEFEDVGNAWGFAEPTFSNGAAYGDLDNDGDLDLVINNENQPAFVYRNNAREQNGNNYIGVVLKGRGKNTFAIGSKIKVYQGEQVYYRELVPSRGFQSSVDYKQVIGLGREGKVDSMIVIWPDRTYSRYDHPGLNQVHRLEQPQQGAAVAEEVTSKAPLLVAVSPAMDKHQEDDYVDFYDERNLPEMLSRQGPQIARGDVNADGLEDVFIGGAKGQAGQLYLQQPGKGWVKKEQESFKAYADFEDVAVLFFDADKDGDLDLFVGSGGNNVHANSRELQHRLYKNDGKGNFKLDPAAFPGNDMNISVAAANDFDEDGDEDLFVGSRSVPYSYGVTPRSYLYQNDGAGHFKDITERVSGELWKIGMVTGAVWSDVSGDQHKELIIVGEWMAPRIFSYKGKRFEEQEQTNLGELYGWWQTVAATDLNGDGKEDLILGNVGENFYLRPDKAHPVKLWLNDFDQSGTTDQFLTRTVGGRDMPVFLKREITDQFPGIKKNSLRHREYATKSIQDLFSGELIAKAGVKQFNYCSSIAAINEGGGKFQVQRLPTRVQLSSVNAVCAIDLNNDRKVDLITGGNNFDFPPQFGRLDASFGDVLINKGKGRLEWLEPNQSGLSLKGVIKDIKETKAGDKKNILIVRNDALPILYQLEK